MMKNAANILFAALLISVVDAMMWQSNVNCCDMVSA